MKVVHVSNSDTNGGAALAALRICRAQQYISNLDSKLLVQLKKSNDKNVFSTQLSLTNKISSALRFALDELAIRLLTLQSKGRFSFPFFGEDITKFDLIKNSDIINLHWINGGFLSLNSLKKIGELKKPIVWTLHDMWAFTGGCHYSSGCEKFIDNCLKCPSLLFKSESDLSEKIFSIKKEIFENLNLTIVTCSKWLAKEASRSRLFSNKKIIIIPNPIDTDFFKPLNLKTSRENLQLPLDKKIILLGAMNLKDERKGFRYLVEALNIIKDTKNILIPEFELLVFGKLDATLLDKIPIKVHQLGKLNTENEIVMAYTSADIYVAPSLEDNLPNTIMEAMACGVPVAAFNVGGIPDMIDNGQNGILAEVKSSNDLADGIRRILVDKELHRNFSGAAREKTLKQFNRKTITEKYYEVYSSILT